ncbi:hypothetical protein NCCP2716_08660 [Sporosarcina sp. NCCP-2716]|uniref:ABC transporter permease subunit n=1 Tax=Sporosarcina sp. NCCP-2716 TaxID=2943679 RepID=UPI00203E19BC|nr:ABC transporter permease subunit [Sporosarcina sp. NCCP-2716]GKV68368.1 hypothetical protein NCCP2716_08660 [Sporosarcina sp. NCCP-2716]
MRLLQFEWKKLWTSGLFKILLLIFFLSIACYFVYAYMNTVRVSDVSLELRDQIREHELQMEEQPQEEDGESSEAAQFWLEYNEKLEAQLKAYETGDWNTVLQMEIDKIQPDLDTLIVSRQYYTSSFPTLFTTETRRALFQYMQEHGVTPILPVDIYAWRTLYDLNFPIDGSNDDEFLKDFVTEHSTLDSSAGIYFLKQVTDLLFGLGGLLFFLLLFSDIVTKEGIGANGPIHLLHTQPIRRPLILLSKFVTVLLTSAVVLVGAALVSLGLGTGFDKLGDWDYPVLVYGENYAYDFMPIGLYLAKTAVLFFFGLLFAAALLFFFSYVTKRAIAALVLTAAVILLGIQLSNQVAGLAFAPYLPFAYLAPPYIVTMQTAAIWQDFRFAFPTGLLVLGSASAVLLAAAYLVSGWQRKRA